MLAADPESPSRLDVSRGGSSGCPTAASTGAAGEAGLRWERPWLPPAEGGRAAVGYDGGPLVPVGFLTHLFRRGGKLV
jgi:hypothetical protein